MTPRKIAPIVGLKADAVRTRKARAVKAVADEIDKVTRNLPPDHIGTSGTETMSRALCAWIERDEVFEGYVRGAAQPWRPGRVRGALLRVRSMPRQASRPTSLASRTLPCWPAEEARATELAPAGRAVGARATGRQRLPAGGRRVVVQGSRCPPDLTPRWPLPPQRRPPLPAAGLRTARAVRRGAHGGEAGARRGPRRRRLLR